MAIWGLLTGALCGVLHPLLLLEHLQNMFFQWNVSVKTKQAIVDVKQPFSVTCLLILLQVVDVFYSFLIPFSTVELPGPVIRTWLMRKAHMS